MVPFTVARASSRYPYEGRAWNYAICANTRFANCSQQQSLIVLSELRKASYYISYLNFSLGQSKGNLKNLTSHSRTPLNIASLIANFLIGLKISLQPSPTFSISTQQESLNSVASQSKSNRMQAATFTF